MNNLSLYLEWFILTLVVIPVIITDLFLTRGKEPTLKTSIWQSLGYISLALAFGGYVAYTRGAADASIYYTAWVLEKTLSVDNIFVMGTIFTAFAIPANKQRMLLYYGIIGVVVFRGICLGGGTAFIAHFGWALYVLGALVVGLGIKILLDNGDDEDEIPWPAQMVKKWGLPLYVTTILAIEFTDVVFATDSIPAVLALSKDPFLVFSSNLFAILGLRSLYFCLQSAQGKFWLLPKTLGLVLVLIGIKALLPLVHVHVSNLISLALVVTLIGGAIAYSLVFPEKEEEKALATS